jgi:hypothetical protein
VIGDVGTSIVNFTASNFVGGFALCPVTIDVRENFIPVAVDDPGFEANSGELKNHDVLFNDLDLDDGVDFITTTTPVSGGTAVVQPDNSVNYTSGLGFGGPDTYTYTITDNDADVSNSATVFIEVDGSNSETPEGPDRPAFGGAGNPANSAPLSATGDAGSSGSNMVQCCTVHDWRVGAGNTKKDGPLAFKRVPFDFSVAMSADPSCVDMPIPPIGELVATREIGVHLNPDFVDPDLPQNYRFGICVVLTDVFWTSPIFLDTDAVKVVGFPVTCESGPVANQPITFARTLNPTEFAKMRSNSVDCDPRGIGKWSEYWFSPNGVHLDWVESSMVYLSKKSSTLKDMLEAMRLDGAVPSAFVDDLKQQVVDAEKHFKGGSKKKDPSNALPILDDATLDALAFGAYGSTTQFPVPVAEIVSHIQALRYGICSELVSPGDLVPACELDPDVEAALPPLL